MSKGTGIGVVILDVVVMDVSRIDVTIMGSNSVDCGCLHASLLCLFWLVWRFG